MRLTILKGHFNWIAAAYPHFVCLYRSAAFFPKYPWFRISCNGIKSFLNYTGHMRAFLFRLKDSIGWNLVWTSPYIEPTVEGIALNAKIANPSQEQCNRMVAACYGTLIQLWSIAEDGSSREIGKSTVNVMQKFTAGCTTVVSIW